MPASPGLVPSASYVGCPACATCQSSFRIVRCCQRGQRPITASSLAGTSEFGADAVSALGDLDQDPMGGGEVVRVETGEDPLGDGSDGADEFGVQGGAVGRELRRAGSVNRAVGDKPLGFQATEEIGNLQPVETDLRLASEVFVQGGRRGHRAANG